MTENKIIKGFKGFKKDMTCQGFQFKEGETYKTDEAKICEKGFHFCEDPLDVLNYYDIADSVFHEVESVGDTDREKGGKDSKVATTEIKIGRRLSLKDFINIAVDKVKAVCKISGYGSKNASSGDWSHNASSGDWSQNASSGDGSKNASSGDGSKNASSGDGSKNASSGDGSKNASSGYGSQNASSGNGSQNASSGDGSQNASSGYGSQNASSGYRSHNASSGDGSQNASSGDESSVEMTGEDSIGVSAGNNCKIKGTKGCWITLSEWVKDEKKNRWVPLCVKSAQIDGKKIKADTWYTLKDGEFVEVE